MSSDVFRKLIEDQERLRKLTNPLGDLDSIINPTGGALAQLTTESSAVTALRDQFDHHKMLADIYGSSSLQKMFEDAEKHRKMIEGPLEEVRRIGLLDPHSDLRTSLAAVTEASRLYESAFRLPVRDELAELAKQASAASSIASTLLDDVQGINTLRDMMEQMTQPWVHMDHVTTSTTAFAELVSIGQSLSQMMPFEANLIEQLRPSLGDWRDPISFAELNLISPLARSALYLDRGVDPDLTDFPVAAFHEGASLVGLGSDPDDGQADHALDTAEDADVARAEKAFAHLRRFEVAVRAFIVEVMEEAFGEHWIKRQLPKGMRDRWEEKRKAEMDAGRPGRPLVEYADFSDYRMIIERNDNWKTAFKPVFRRPEDVRESFQRLNPVRIATMHSRIVTLDDELLLMVETRRVLKAIQLKSR